MTYCVFDEGCDVHCYRSDIGYIIHLKHPDLLTEDTLEVDKDVYLGDLESTIYTLEDLQDRGYRFPADVLVILSGELEGEEYYE